MFPDLILIDVHNSPHYIVIFCELSIININSPNNGKKSKDNP